MKTRDILFLCQFFYPEYNTSAILPFQTASYLAKNGYKVDALCGYPKEYTDSEKELPLKEEVEGVSIQRVRYLQFSRSNVIARLINYFSFFVSIFLNFHKMQKYKIIVVYTNPPILPLIAVMAKKLFGCEIIFVAYDVYPEIAIETDVLQQNSIITKIMNKINDKLYQSANVVALSNDMKSFMINNRKINEDKITVINNWATEDINELSKDKNKESDNEFLISYLGNMGIAQEFETILNALNDTRIRGKNIRFIFAGHGNKRERIKEFVDENNMEHVEVLGYLRGDEFSKLVNMTDAFFLSLKPRLTGLAVPSKFYTYVASNKPIIAVIDEKSDIFREINNFNLGIAVNHNEKDELVDKLISIYEAKEAPDFSDIYNSYYAKKVQLERYNKLIKSILNK